MSPKKQTEDALDKVNAGVVKVRKRMDQATADAVKKAFSGVAIEDCQVATEGGSGKAGDVPGTTVILVAVAVPTTTEMDG